MTQKYELRVGMECHAELLTNSKMFCGCENAFGGDANTRTCPICLALPGTLPVFNAKAVELVVRAALALNCEISPHSIFHRKNYFYPDLPKGYQISQYGNTPIGVNGWLEIEKADGTIKRIQITRVHLEEDTGKSIHSDGLGYSVMDYNRAGVPLMEIVTAFPPDVETSEEARLYAETLRSVLVTIGVTDGRMEQGSLRVEPNPSVRPVGSETFGVKTELKNLNSFQSVQRGIEFEMRRQIETLESGGVVRQETRGWNADEGISFAQRSKEVEQEYRYFPEPDLIPIDFTPEYIENVRQSLPELPLVRRRRFMKQYGLPPADAAQLADERPVADFYEAAANGTEDAKAVSNWLIGDLLRLAKADDKAVYETPVSAANLAGLVNLVADGTITGKLAKSIIEAMYSSGKTATQIVQEQGLSVTGADIVAQAVAKVIAENADIVAKIKAGNEKPLAALVGLVMKETKGRARPDDVNRLLRDELDRLP